MNEIGRPQTGRGSNVAELRGGLSALQAYQRIIREWAAHLDPYEFMVAIQIADRTIGWQKTRVAFSLNRVLTGDNGWAPLPISRRKLFYVLNGLEQKGMISRLDHPEGKEIKVYAINLGWSPDMLKLPKRLQTGAPRALPRCTPCTTPVHDVHPREGIGGERIKEKEDHSVSATPRPVLASVDQVREKMEMASTASRAAPSAKVEKLADRVGGVEASWRIALEEAHPEVGFAAWSVREKAMVKAKLKTWIVKDGPMVEFVDWAVRNWNAIISKQFRWMTRSPAPKVPEIGFVLSFMGQFLECRAEGKLESWLASPERSEFEKLTKRGLSDQEAAAEIGKRRAVEGMRDENEKVQIEARARVRRAQIIEKRTELMANLPPHPDSTVARRARGNDTTVRVSSGPVPDINQPLLDPNWEPPE